MYIKQKIEAEFLGDTVIIVEGAREMKFGPSSGGRNKQGGRIEAISSLFTILAGFNGSLSPCLVRRLERHGSLVLMNISNGTTRFSTLRCGHT